MKEKVMITKNKFLIAASAVAMAVSVPAWAETSANANAEVKADAPPFRRMPNVSGKM
jgi:hypothetical protein